MKLRAEQEQELEKACQSSMCDCLHQSLQPGSTKRLGDVTSVNLTMLAGGVQVNVVPAEVSACLLLSLHGAA